MITSIEARRVESDGSYIYDPITIPVGIPDLSTLFFASNIDGVDPAKANLSFSPRASIDGTFFQNARVNQRNIVLTVDILRKMTGNVRQQRLALAQIFMPKSRVDLAFTVIGSTSPYRISTVVESFDASLFDRNNKIQISMLSLNTPYFNLNKLEYNLTASSASNPETFNNLGVDTGSVDCGYRITVDIGDTAFSGGQLLTRWNSNFVIQGNIPENRKLVIDTREGYKECYHTNASDGDRKDFLYGVAANTKWPKLKAGVLNGVNFLTTPSVSRTYKVEYYPLVGGL